MNSIIFNITTLVIVRQNWMFYFRIELIHKCDNFGLYIKTGILHALIIHFLVKILIIGKKCWVQLVYLYLVDIDVSILFTTVNNNIFVIVLFTFIFWKYLNYCLSIVSYPIFCGIINFILLVIEHAICITQIFKNFEKP